MHRAFFSAQTGAEIYVHFLSLTFICPYVPFRFFLLRIEMLWPVWSSSYSGERRLKGPTQHFTVPSSDQCDSPGGAKVH